ncbi:YceI family protein [Kolteria novifilia]
MSAAPKSGWPSVVAMPHLEVSHGKDSIMRGLARVMAIAIGVATCSVSAMAEEKIPFSNDGSKIEWTGTKDDGKHVGGFGKFDGHVVMAGNEPKLLHVDIDTSSIYSDNDKLTSHLKSPDFFHVGKHPKATFTSTSITKGGEGKATHTINGKLTMLGKTQEVQLPAMVTDTEGQFALQSQFTINRSKHGIDYGQGKIHEAVPMSINVRAKH